MVSRGDATLPPSFSTSSEPPPLEANATTGTATWNNSSTTLGNGSSREVGRKHPTRHGKERYRNHTPTKCMRFLLAPGGSLDSIAFRVAGAPMSQPDGVDIGSCGSEFRQAQSTKRSIPFLWSGEPTASTTFVSGSKPNRLRNLARASALLERHLFLR